MTASASEVEETYPADAEASVPMHAEPQACHCRALRDLVKVRDTAPFCVLSGVPLFSFFRSRFGSGRTLITTRPRAARGARVRVLTIRRQNSGAGWGPAPETRDVEAADGRDAKMGDKATKGGSTLDLAWRRGDGDCPKHQPGARGDSAIASLRARLNAILRDVEDDSPGATDDARFTVVLNTFERRDLLQRAVAHYATCASVAEIVVVWSEQTPAPKETDADARLYFPAPRKKNAAHPPPRARYEAHDTTSIQNRFEVTGVTTSAVFHVDDDVRMPCGALDKGFEAWRANRNVLVGFFPRAHKWSAPLCRHAYVWDDWSLRSGGEFSIVLTKAAFSKTQYLELYKRGLPPEAREYIDERKNCEDVAMQLLTSAATNAPPVYVAQPLWHYWRAKLEGIGVAGISKGSNHHDLRGACVTDLSRILLEQARDAEENVDATKMASSGNRFGDTPLVAAPLRRWTPE